MLTTFIPCGAKIPVIALFSGAFFAGAGWLVENNIHFVHPCYGCLCDGGNLWIPELLSEEDVEREIAKLEKEEENIRGKQKQNDQS